VKGVSAGFADDHLFGRSRGRSVMPAVGTVLFSRRFVRGRVTDSVTDGVVVRHRDSFVDLGAVPEFSRGCQDGVASTVLSLFRMHGRCRQTFLRYGLADGERCAAKASFLDPVSRAVACGLTHGGASQ
jgi:hypothetical protein